jgi:hypothetical protein
VGSLCDRCQSDQRRMPTGRKGSNARGLPPEAIGRAVEEYIAVLDDAAFGAATDVAPKFVSQADPAARWTGAHGGQAFFAYSTAHLINVDLLAAGPTAAILDGISALQSGEAIVSTVIQSNTQNGHFPHWKLKTGGVIMPDERLSWVQTIVSASSTASRWRVERSLLPSSWGLIRTLRCFSPESVP